MLLRYALTYDARLHLAEYQAAQQNALSNEKYILNIFLFISGLLILIVGLLLPDLLIKSMILSQLLMWWSAVPLLTRKSMSKIKRNALHQFKEDPFEYITTRTLDLQPEGLSLIMPFGSRFFHNTQLRICDRQNEGFAYLWLLDDVVICIPKHTVFEGDFERFTTALQERIEQRDWVTSFRSMLEQSTFLPNPAKLTQQVTFRPYNKHKDLESCLAIYKSNKNSLPQSQLTYYEQFLHESPWESYVVMELDGEVIGCGGLLWNQQSGTMQLICGFIHHDWQRKGLGGLLLMYRLAMLRECTHEQVLGIGLETSPEQAGFYLPFGFFIIAHQHNRYGEEQIRFDLWKYFYPEEIRTIYELVKAYQPPTL